MSVSCAQLEVSRNTITSLISTPASSRNGGPAPEVQLSPYLDTSSLPGTVDTMRTTWPVNPFGSLPSDSAALGSVLEFSLVNASSPGRATLPLPNVSAVSNSMPVHFRVRIGGLDRSYDVILVFLDRIRVYHSVLPCSLR